MGRIRRRVGAVLQTLGHKTDIGATVAGARGTGNYSLVASGARVLLGWSLSETAGAAAEARLHDGGANTAPLLTGGITFAANGTSAMWFADEGVEVTSGAIELEVVSGSIRGVVYWG